MEPVCCFDAREYTGVPDTRPCPRALDVPEVIKELDALYEQGRDSQAERFLEAQREKASLAGEWRGKLSMLSELRGQHRRSKNEEKGLMAVEDGLRLIREHNMGQTLSGATVMLNAATTMKCFGQAESSIPVFSHVCRVYAQSLDPMDYRFAGLYNNMALSCADAGRYEEAERYYQLAMKIMSKLPAGENEIAVTLCNLAELYDRQDHEDMRIGQCMERAWEVLNTPGLPRDGYHAFNIAKCAPSFDYFGYFLWAKELKERAEKIYGGT